MAAFSKHQGANLNLQRRPFPGLLAKAALAPLGPLLRLLQRPARAASPSAPVFVFASYMVGDVFMALPALKKLAAARPVRVLCRPDCVGLLAAEGLAAIPFDNAFFTSRSPGGLARTLRAARTLRRHRDAATATTALDLDANPVSALCLRLAGFARVISYQRDYGALFTETFALPPDAVHQVDRDAAVVEYVLRNDRGRWTVDGGKHPSKTDAKKAETGGNSESDVPPSTVYRPPSFASPWLLSVWTRKAPKNWPLEEWSILLEGLLNQGVECAVLLAPDGDEHYGRFHQRWMGRVPFVGGSLTEVADAVRGAAGVITTDNFLGHMAGYYGKSVVWINIVSPAAQVMPRGPQTLEVAPDDQGRLSVEAVRSAFDRIRKD
jgi:ADP-heptose:LPS heptosyltransferase